jgi:hypothetical protein
MDSPKQKFALKISPEILKMVEKNYKEDGCGCRSAFIEKAILFYCGYLTASDYREYFPNVIVSTTKGMLDSFENRMASIIFKMAVEISMLLHVFAATHRISEETLTDLRRMCIDDVKKINGTISLADAVKFQKG